MSDGDLLRLVVVDDEPLARKTIRLLARRDPEVTIVAECGNGTEALQAIREHHPDLVFLDVQMPELDGFDVLEALGAPGDPGHRTPAIVFVTAYDQYAIRAFEVHAIDYLLKPFSDERFEKALARAKDLVRRSRPEEARRNLAALTAAHRATARRFMVRSAGRVVFLKADEIDWIEAADYYARLHAGGHSYLLRESMNDLEAALDPDILILPGGGAEPVLEDPAWMEWVKTSGRNAGVVLTVCTGAFIAGHAGLLEGIEATTWYNAVAGLQEEFPKTRVLPGRRFVDSGKVITTAGVSAGIDGALHLVARLLGRTVADRTAEYMEYKWMPDSYLTAHYVQLNPQLDDHGLALQQAGILIREGNRDGAIAIYRTLLAAGPNDAETWLSLGRVLHAAQRYPEAIAANLEAAKAAPQRPLALFNLACAYALAGEREKAIEAAARAVDAGYRVKWSYAQDSGLASIREDGRFKALVAGL